MGVPTSEVGYNSATARRRDHESSYEHVVALEREREGGGRDIERERDFVFLRTAILIKRNKAACLKTN